MRQGDQLLNRGVAFSGFSRDTGNGVGMKEKTAPEGRSRRGQGR
jgi:hypothetical protein